jgi:uncharacterized protein (TIGR04255 family)
MSVIFENPPLIEVMCEFRFNAGLPWDWTVPGLVYSRVRHDFPDKHEQPAFELELPAGVLSPPINNVSRVQFLRKDRSALLQVGPNLLTVNHLRPYPTWQRFRALIAEQLEVYRNVAQPKSIQRIGLRYINRIEVPQLEPGIPIEIEHYLIAAPGLPETLKGRTLVNFGQRVEIDIREAKGILVLQSSSVLPESEGNVAFLLDLDFITANGTDTDLADAMLWVERAHARIEEAFLACITAASRRLFGVKDDATTQP